MKSLKWSKLWKLMTDIECRKPVHVLETRPRSWGLNDMRRAKASVVFPFSSVCISSILDWFDIPFCSSKGSRNRCNYRMLIGFWNPNYRFGLDDLEWLSLCCSIWWQEPHLRRKVKLSNSEIISVKRVDMKWIKWSGAGWRIKRLKYISYIPITNNVSGVQIKTTQKGGLYAVNCNVFQSVLNGLHGAGITI